MKKLFIKYKEVILYVFFGGCTTLVNFIAYFIFARVLHCSTVTSNIIAFILSVLFAYVTNKIWVFESKTETKEALIKEFTSFISCRLFSGGVDLFIMYLFVDILFFNDLIIKILSNVIVIVMNYVLSKLIIFKKGD